MLSVSHCLTALQFYALYKQGSLASASHKHSALTLTLNTANEGDVKTARPGMMDFTGKAKWDAYKAVEGMSKEEAASKYVDALLAILKANDSDESRQYISEIENA